MMVGVPVLLMVWVCACWPFVWVMVVGEGCSGWCCFQCCVAVVCASRRVPGVVVGFGVWVACSGVGWLVPGVSGAKACVAWLVCVLWFRILTCLASFFLLVLSFVLSCCLVNNGLSWVWCGGLCVCGVVVVFCLCVWCGRVLVARRGVGWWLVVFVLVCGRVRVFCGRAKVCLFASCGLLGCCLCVGLA